MIHSTANISSNLAYPQLTLAGALRNEKSCMGPPLQFLLIQKLVTRHKTPRPSHAVLRAWGCGGVCIKSSGGALQECRRGGLEVLALERPAHRGPKW